MVRIDVLYYLLHYLRECGSMFTEHEECLLSPPQRGIRRRFINSLKRNVLWIGLLWLCLVGGFLIARKIDDEESTDSSLMAFGAQRFSSSSVCAQSLKDAVTGYLKAIMVNDDKMVYDYFAPDFQLHFHATSTPNKVAILNGTVGYDHFADWWFDNYRDGTHAPALRTRKITHSQTDFVARTWDLDFHWELADGSLISATEMYLFTTGNCIWRTYTHLTSNHAGLPPGNIVDA